MTALEPIHVHVPGTLSLKVSLIPQSDSEVLVQGVLGYAMHASIEGALRFLPLGLGRSLSKGLIQSELVGDSYRFKVGQFTSIEAEVNSFGVMVLKAHYPMPLARPVAHGETTRVFREFVDSLYRQGVTPSGEAIIDHFLRGFCRKDRGELDFLSLFEGRTIQRPEGPHPRVSDLRVQQLQLKQNTLKDLEVHFEALGALSF